MLHPTQDRLISVRECARAQGFPDSFVFAGSVKEMHKQVGGGEGRGVGGHKRGPHCLNEWLSWCWCLGGLWAGGMVVALACYGVGP